MASDRQQTGRGQADANGGQMNAASGNKTEAVLAKWTETVSRRDAASVPSLHAPDAILVPMMTDEAHRNEDARRNNFGSFLATEGLQCGITDRKTRANPERGKVAIAGRSCFSTRREGRDELIPAGFLFNFEVIGGEWLVTSHHSSQAVG